MKTQHTFLVSAGLMLATAALGLAQDPAPGEGGPAGRGARGGERRPPPPVISALDLNKDGELSAEEIAKASESLKTLDKNGDGKLTQDELRPPRPPEGEGGGRGRPPGGGPPPQGGPQKR